MLKTLICLCKNLIEYMNENEKTLETLWQYYRDDPVLGNSSNIADFTDAN